MCYSVVIKLLQLVLQNAAQTSKRDANHHAGQCRAVDNDIRSLSDIHTHQHADACGQECKRQAPGTGVDLGIHSCRANPSGCDGSCVECWRESGHSCHAAALTVREVDSCDDASPDEAPNTSSTPISPMGSIDKSAGTS